MLPGCQLDFIFQGDVMTRRRHNGKVKVKLKKKKKKKKNAFIF